MMTRFKISVTTCSRSLMCIIVAEQWNLLPRLVYVVGFK